MIHLPFIFIMGTIFGSFFNVCIYRIPVGLPLSFPGSHCYRCGRGVAWYDNLPLLSYWILRGRCRHCGATFSSRYFLVELLTGLLFLLAFMRIQYSLALLPALIFISLLIVATFTDIDHWIIPDRISIGGMAAGIILAAIYPLGLGIGNPLSSSNWQPVIPTLLSVVQELAGGGSILTMGDNTLVAKLMSVPQAWHPLIYSLDGAAMGWLILWSIGKLGTVIFRKEAMGGGDIKLFAMFGAFTGAEYLVYILVIACVLGTLAALVGMIFGALAKKQPLPESVAQLTPTRHDPENMIGQKPMTAAERLAIKNAVTSPGTVGPVRHHLPFGPPLAVAAIIVYLYGGVIAQALRIFMLGQDPLL